MTLHHSAAASRAADLDGSMSAGGQMSGDILGFVVCQSTVALVRAVLSLH